MKRLLLVLASVAAAEEPPTYRQQIEEAGDDRAKWAAIAERARSEEHGLSQLLMGCFDIEGPSPVPNAIPHRLRPLIARLRPAFDADAAKTIEALRRVGKLGGSAGCMAWATTWLGLEHEFVDELLRSGNGRALGRTRNAAAIETIAAAAEKGRDHAVTACATSRARRAREAFWKAFEASGRPDREMMLLRTLTATPYDLEAAAALLEKKPGSLKTEACLNFLIFRGPGAPLDRLRAVSFDDARLREFLERALVGNGDEASAAAVLKRLPGLGAEQRPHVLATLAAGRAPDGLRAVAAAWPALDHEARHLVLPAWIQSGEPAVVDAALALYADPEERDLALATVPWLFWKRPDVARDALPRFLDVHPALADAIRSQDDHGWSTEERVALMDAVLAAAEASEKHREVLLRMFEGLDPWEIGWPFGNVEEARTWWDRQRETSLKRSW